MVPTAPGVSASGRSSASGVLAPEARYSNAAAVRLPPQNFDINLLALPTEIGTAHPCERDKERDKKNFRVSAQLGRHAPWVPFHSSLVLLAGFLFCVSTC